MKPLNFETGELVKLGPHLWSDVYTTSATNNCVWKGLVGEERYLENQIVLYIEPIVPKTNRDNTYHKILYCNKFYFITDNSYAIDEDSKRNLQKVSI